MVVLDRGRMDAGRVSPVRTRALHGVKPGYGCLTCPLPSCHGCVRVMPTREEAAMLHCGGAGGGRNEKTLRAAATALSAEEKDSNGIVSRTKGENQDEATKADI